MRIDEKGSAPKIAVIETTIGRRTVAFVRHDTVFLALEISRLRLAWSYYKIYGCGASP